MRKVFPKRGEEPAAGDQAALRQEVRLIMGRAPHIPAHNTGRAAGGFVIEAFCDQLAETVGNPVRLLAVEATALGHFPYSAVEAQADSYVIYYPEEVEDIPYRDSLILRQAAWLLSGLDVPKLAFPLTPWSGFDTADKILIEIVAMQLTVKADQARLSPPSTHPAPALGATEPGVSPALPTR